jgi:hypothetical protein
VDNQAEGQVRYDQGGWISGPCLDRPLNSPPGMSGEDATLLWHLRCLWEDRYQIVYAGGQWHAARVGSFSNFNITGDTAAVLREKIGEDYRQWQIQARRMNGCS